MELHNLPIVVKIAIFIVPLLPFIIHFIFTGRLPSFSSVLLAGPLPVIKEDESDPITVEKSSNKGE